MTDTADQQPPTVRKTLKPFGTDKTHELTMKQKALSTMSRQQAFDRGYLSVKDLDDEELRYGKCRDKHGLIPRNGNKTELIPKDKYDDMIAEHEMRFQQKLRQNLDDMLDGMVKIAKDESVEPRERLDAMKYLIDRTAGKATEHVAVTVTAKPWEDLLNQVTGIAPMSRAEHRALQGAGIVDAEVVDEDQDEHDLQPEDVPPGSTHTTEQDVVPVHKVRPSEQPDLQQLPDDTHKAKATFVGEEPEPGQPYFEHVPIPVGPDVRVRPDNNKQQPSPDQRAHVPDNPELDYGRRADEKRSYAEQVREAEQRAKMRKEHRERIQAAKKARKIIRATGADAIETDITGATVGPDGKVTFE